MIEPNEYIQLKAYARQLGALMGLLWVTSFACFVGVVSLPLLSIIFDFSIVIIPFVAYYMVRYYRDTVINGNISFKRAFVFSLLIFIYASLILGISQWAYFALLDGGRMVANIQEVMQSAEYKSVIDAYKAQGVDLKEQMNILTEARPIDFAMTFMWFNFLAGTVISWVVALFVKRHSQPTSQMGGE